MARAPTCVSPHWPVGQVDGHRMTRCRRAVTFATRRIPSHTRWKSTILCSRRFCHRPDRGFSWVWWYCWHGGWYRAASVLCLSRHLPCCPGHELYGTREGRADRLIVSTARLASFRPSDKGILAPVGWPDPGVPREVVRCSRAPELRSGKIGAGVKRRHQSLQFRR
jgi:hypothetical protein